MAEHFGVFDLVGNRNFTYFKGEDIDQVREPVTRGLMPMLVVPRDSDDNRSSRIMDEDHISMDDILVKDRNGLSLDFSNVYSLEGMLLGLEREVYSDGKSFSVQSGLLRKGRISPVDMQERLGEWFRYQKAVLKSDIEDTADTAFSTANNIVLVPDFVSIDVQERLLKAAGRDSKFTLLWRSVAAAIGAEDNFPVYGLKDGDIISVVDRNRFAVTVTNLQLHLVEKRLIPGHHLYKYSDKEERNVQWYPYEEVKTSFSNSDFFPYEVCTEGFIVPADRYRIVNRIDKSMEIPRNAKLVITIGDKNDCRWVHCPVVHDPDGSMLIKGAGRFANRMNNGLVSYYDECESLNLVVFKTKTEEIEFKTLIDHNDKLTGGMKVEGDICRDVAYDAKRNHNGVDFYLRLGTSSASEPLKILAQPVEINDMGEKVPDVIPLEMSSSLIAGQGRAKVTVRARYAEHRKYFQEVELDWSAMEDALIDSEHPGKGIKTLNWLIENQERSFPVNVPRTKADIRKYKYVESQVKQYLIKGYKTAKAIKLNRSTYVDSNAEGIEKFQRSNIMGANWREAYRSLGNEQYESLSTMCRALASDAKYHPKASSLYTVIGWTYDDSGVFDEVVSEIMKEARVAGESKKPFMNQKITIIANIVHDDDLIAEFFYDFALRLGYVDRKNISYWGDVHQGEAEVPSGIQNWLRGMSQLLMNHSSFIEKYKHRMNIVRFCARQLTRFLYSCILIDKDRDSGYEIEQKNRYYYEFEKESPDETLMRRYRRYLYDYLNRSYITLFSYALKTFIFLLKFRRVDGSFLKADSDREEDRRIYWALKHCIGMSNDFRCKLRDSKDCNVKVCNTMKMLEKFLDGKGNLELPSVETDEDEDNDE